MSGREPVRLGWGDGGEEHQQMTSRDQAGGRGGQGKTMGAWVRTLTFILSETGEIGGVSADK